MTIFIGDKKVAAHPDEFLVIAAIEDAKPEPLLLVQNIGTGERTWMLLCEWNNLDVNY